MVATLAPAISADFKAPVFSVSLSEDPATRWTEPVNYILDTYGFDESFQHVLDYVSIAVQASAMLHLIILSRM